jgi:hypothetical protein
MLKITKMKIMKILRYPVLIALLASIMISFIPDTVKLFDGKTLEGWKCEPAELVHHWKVERGKLIGENPDKKGSILWTTRSYRDYDLELKYMTLSDDYDTGVFLRGGGHQVQIGISRSLQRDMTACIYAPGDGMGAYPGQTDKVMQFHHPGHWNHLRIILEGKRIRTFLNGEPMVDYEGNTIGQSGPIGLQMHSNVHMAVYFKDIKIKEL